MSTRRAKSIARSTNNGGHAKQYAAQSVRHSFGYRLSRNFRALLPCSKLRLQTVVASACFKSHSWHSADRFGTTAWWPQPGGRRVFTDARACVCSLNSKDVFFPRSGSFCLIFEWPKRVTTSHRRDENREAAWTYPGPRPGRCRCDCDCLLH